MIEEREEIETERATETGDRETGHRREAETEKRQEIKGVRETEKEMIKRKTERQKQGTGERQR